MAAVLIVDDLAPFADIEPVKAQAMVDDVLALAARVAPCLSTATDDGVIAAARAILRGAVLRWNEAGTASYQAQHASPPGYPVDPLRERRNLLWPSEIEALSELCGTPDAGGAFSVDTAGPTARAGHADICALNFGALYCSCGAVLTNHLYPLYEV